MSVLWIGHEADCYILGSSNSTESTAVSDAVYERTGMRAGNGGSGNLTSSPDWGAVDELWHRFNHNTQNGSTNWLIWGAQNAAGTNVARIIESPAATLQFQVWNGAAYVNVGAGVAMLGSLAKARFDVHFKGGAAGQVEVWYGSPGSQTKIVDTTGSYTSAVSIVRIFHGCNSVGGGFNTDVAHEVVQTTPTLNTTSETKPPTSDGADTDGGVGGWANVDETTYSDADYIALTASGKHQSFKSAARTGSQSVVTGVTVSARAWYEGGGPTQMKPYLTIGGTRYYGPAFTLDVVAKGYQYTFLLNPATGVAFTVAEANAATLEYGWEAV